jgi:hypothetical protein
MRHLFIRACVTTIIVFCLALTARAQGAANGAEQPLVPCVAVAADGTPIMAGNSLPSSKKLTVAFRLPADDQSKVLKSRWVALVGSTEGDIAENTLDLKGQKTGWLRLSLKQPAPAGKYRLETKLDDKPWKSIELNVVAPPEQGKAGKPSDLIPLEEGKTANYEMVIRPQPGTKVDVPGVTPEADGTIRTTIGTKVGKADDAGTQYEVSINDKPVGMMWVKLDERGLQAHRMKEGDNAKEINPPKMIYPLPPQLEDGTEWIVKSDDGGEQKLTLYGPMTIDGPSGPATGYLILSEEQTSTGSPGTEAVRGKNSIERYFVPKVGLVREVQVDTLSGKLTTRREIKLGGSQAYTLVADPNMKGRLGRVQCAYPADTKFSDAHVEIFKGEAKPDASPMTAGYGDKSFELMPGRYTVSINNKAVPVEVKSGHNTVPRVGVLRVQAGSQTHFRVLDADGKTELFAGYGTRDIALPVGSYVLDISGSQEPVKVENGKVTEF